MPITSTDFDNAEIDLQTASIVSNSKTLAGTPTDSTLTRLGDTVDTLNGRLKKLGYLPPIAYVGGIIFTALDNVKTVEESGSRYAPRIDSLPFTTSGTWIGDDENKFYLIEGAKATEISAEFETVADMVNGVTTSGTTIDWSNYEKSGMETVYHNLTSKAGGNKYIKKTAAQAAADGDVIDGTGAPNYYGANHALNGGTHVAVISLNENGVNVKKFGANDDYDTVAGVITTDSLIPFNLCRDYCKRSTGKYRSMFVPGYAYYLSDTFDLSSEALDPALSDRRQGFNLIFENRTTEFLQGTQIFVAGGSTGVGIDTSGTDGITTRNLSVRSAVIDGCRVGMLQARTAGAGQTLWAGDQKHHDLFIDMKSDTSYPDNFGTIGFINLGGEECSYENAQIWANTPVIHTSTRAVIKTGDTLDNTANDSIDLQQFSAKTLDTAASNTVFRWYGLGRIVAYDYISPCLLINNAATLDMGATFFQKRESHIGGVTLGDNNWAIDCWNCFEFKHFGAVEGSKNYMIQRRAMTGAEVNVVLNQDATVPGSDREAWYLFSDGGTYNLENCDINIRNLNSSGVLGGKRSDNSTTSELQFTLRNVDFKYSNAYSVNPIDKRALRTMLTGCTLRYDDIELLIPHRGIIETTLFNKNVGDTTDSPALLFDVEYPGYQTNLGSAFVNVLMNGSISNISTSGGGAAGSADPASRNFNVSANSVRINNAQDIYVPAVSPLTDTVGDQALTNISAFNMAAVDFTMVDNDAANKVEVYAKSAASGSTAGITPVYITAKIQIFWGGGVNDAPLLTIA